MHARATLLTATVGVLLSASFGSAWADGVPPASVTTERYDWTGLYVGVHLGGGVNLIDVTDPLGPALFGNPIRSPGPFGGLQAGYNYQSGIMVYGLEAEISFPQMEGTNTCSATDAAIVNSTCRLNTDFVGNLAARLGVAVGPQDRGLVYGKTGVAWSTGSIDIATNDMLGGVLGNPVDATSASLTQWGWTIGAGAEYALSSKWSVKGEYDYTTFGDRGVTLLPTAYLDAAGTVTTTVPTRQGQVSQDTHAVKIGLNYRIDGGDLTGIEQEDEPRPAGHLPFGFEVGGRYWYSWGRHKYDLGFGKADNRPIISDVSRLNYDDLQTNAGEVVGRITAPWNLFAKGFIGTGTTTNGHMNDEDFVLREELPGGGFGPTVPYTNALLGGIRGGMPWYGTIDVGYDWWRTNGYRFGTYVGYNYFRESLGAYGCVQLINPLGPCGPGGGGAIAPTGHAVISQDGRWQSLRLGAETEFYLAPRFKVSADAAYLPYVTVDAADNHFSGNTATVASVNPMTGTGVGTQLEVMFSYDVTDRWSVGVGGRYWAMWTTNASDRRTYDRERGGPQASQPPIDIKLESERTGLLGQVLYKFD